MKQFKHFSVFVLIALFSVILGGCTVKEDKEATLLFDKLQGYWETAHVYEVDDYYYVGENIPYHDVSDRDINQGDEDYAVLRFTPEYVTFVATSDPEVANYIGTPVPYSVTKDGKLYSYITRGDYTDHVTIEFKDDNTLLMYLDDEGSDDEIVSDYYSITTFRRVDAK